MVEKATKTKRTALIVEDEESMLSALSDKFERAGFEVLKAKDGESGLAIAFERRPQVIILDVIMPHMDGVTMLEDLRHDSWGAKVPVIVLSNLNDEEIISKSFKEGVYDYLVKANVKISDVVKKAEEIVDIMEKM